MSLLCLPGSGSYETRTTHLFSPLTIRGVTFRNRIMVSPMCMYSSKDGFVNDWHIVHLGSRAVGGAGLVMTEATAVEARGMITSYDLGIWNDLHIEGLARLVHFLKEQGAVPGIQLAHAGRKAGSNRPWESSMLSPADKGDWLGEILSVSPDPFPQGKNIPHELTIGDIGDLIRAFVVGAQRAVQAGFEVLEIHGAHGYLINQFLSPAVNKRQDAYGGSLENRVRFLLEVVRGIREVIPVELPLFVRLSSTDWLPEGEPGWTLADSVVLSKILAHEGVDLIDASSGGVSPRQQIKIEPGYQVPFAERIRQETSIMTAAVGLISEPEQADAIIRNGQADLVAIAREMLRDPYWPRHAAKVLGQTIKWPDQYDWSFL